MAVIMIVITITVFVDDYHVLPTETHRPPAVVTCSVTRPTASCRHCGHSSCSSSPSECCPSLSLSSPLSYSGLRYAAAVSSPQFPRPPSSLTEPSHDDHEYFDGPTDDRARTTTTSSGVITHKRQRAAFLSIFMAIIKERMGRSTIVMVHTDFVDGLHQTVATVADRANIEAPAVKTRQSLSAFSHTTSSSPMLTLPIVNLVVPRRFLSIGIVFNGLHKKTGNTTVQCCHCCGWLLSKGIVVGALMS